VKGPEGTLWHPTQSTGPLAPKYAIMTMKLYAVLGATLAMTLISTTAQAVCPTAFSSSTYTCSGATQGAICVKNSATDIDCNMVGTGFGNYATQGATAYFVSPTRTSFDAYGWDGQGEKFCCEFTGLTNGCVSNPISVDIAGTVYADTLKLDDIIQSTALDCATANLKGGDEDDDLTGSHYTTNHDYLWGEDGSDVIRGLEGDDVIRGEAGDDYLYGNDGDDFIYGGADIDHIKGGPGGDYLYGDGGEDYICGGLGNDALEGGDEDDEITGEAGIDTNDGGDHDGGDECEDDGMLNCEGSMLLDTLCPW
jgi:Ca2+-binding RTX toxin-like protein